jgi:carbon monoxide dehydrogenase subunit G
MFRAGLSLSASRALSPGYLGTHPRMTVNLDLQLAIDAPPEKVFAAITDLHAGGRWLPGCTKLEVLTPGPYARGTRWRETRKFGGHEATEEFEVTDVTAPRVIELHCDGRRGSSGNVDYHFRYDLEPLGQSTVLKMTGRIVPAGWFGWIMARLMKLPFMQALRRDHAALKAHVESDGKPLPKHQAS